MKANIQIFTSEVFGEIRTCQVNNQIMFMGVDVAKALGYTNTQKAIRDHVDDDDKLTERFVLSSQARRVIIINERSAQRNRPYFYVANQIIGSFFSIV